MANILLSPNLSQLVPGAGVERKAQLPVNEDASFAQHLERKFQAEQREKKNLLGTESSKVKASKSERSAADEEAPATVEALLQQVMTKLKELAEKPGDGAEAGQWTFQLQDIGLLEKLAAQAGMDVASLAALKKQMSEQGGLPLADLFDALAKNFQDLDADTKVTVPETYLPLLETLLSKLGVSPEAIKELDSKGVNGVDQLDLIAYLQALKDVQAKAEGQGQASAPTCVLSDWELEQLSAMLAEAGVPSEKIELLFPEKMPLWQKALAGIRPEQGDTAVEISLDRLQDILQQAISAVDQARPKADLPGFLTELETVLGQAGFKSSDVGWSPVVQGSVKSAYDELQKMIDQAKVQEKTIEIKVQNATVDEEWQLSEVKVVEASTTAEKESDGLGGDSFAGPKDGLLQVDDSLGEEIVGVSGAEMKAAPQVPTEPSIRVQAPRAHLSPEMQQLTIEQISQGVLRGLRNNEHHLTLTLYPKELGEVKVDLQMRGNQMSANFVMENQKVKEAMESNMEEFKDNLERRGFSLESMSVSVGGQNHSSDSGQRFVEAWEQIKANQNRELTAVAGASPLEFVHNEQSTLRQGGISLFV